MAFNLNKGGEDKKEFNLSKSPVVTSEINPEKEEKQVFAEGGKKKKKPTGPFVLLAVVVLAGAIWYFVGNKNSSNASSVALSMHDTPKANDVPIQNLEVKATEQSQANGGNDAGNTKDTVATSLPQGIPVALNNAVVADFKAGSTLLSRVSDNTVNEIINYLSITPASKIIVNGYASSEGLLSLNQALSQQRADAFKALLVSKGIDKGRILAAGKGIEHPLVSNDTDEGRIKNRRVEVLFQ